MRALRLHVAENGHAANKDDENVETPGVGQALPLDFLHLSNGGGLRLRSLKARALNP